MNKKAAKGYMYLALTRSQIDQDTALSIVNEFEFISECISEEEAERFLDDAYKEADRYE